MKEKLKLGVIGAGGIFRHAHAPAWLSHPEIEIVAISDPVVEAAAAFAKEHGIPQVFKDYHDLLAQEEIDVVDICTPNSLHSEIAIAALKAGKHVFCEKPDAVNAEEAKKMARTAGETGKRLMVMRNNRFNPASQFMKKYVDAGHMGDIYTGRCGWIRRRGIPGRGGWFTTKELSGGGPLIDLGVHFIDVAMWLMGNPRPVAVVGATYNKFASADELETGTFDVEDLASGFIRFENGATLQIEFSWASNVEEEMNFYELRGTKSGVHFKNGELKIFSEIEGTLVDIIPRLPEHKISDHTSNINHFVNVLQGREEPILTPEHGVHMIEILTAIYESARLGREVLL
ncbi:Gfo/Idh/MocA family oxidoreductase [Pullulanibacillus sp. KACC 23026]|uniref:Gfo/Idh/MocA family protein n=1 Tax=Pullulanibacillus sp. KACC 23026 TaxID=3028315 RepID=UPI0023AF34F9|nr:Gfo/Idh/MocA family oxidoreductase [Pullulanibacillus sp. KACC 23026]WEG13184.1 Gfo/Idh/MocA family oxidoreductase [Pullulanibacillus sp. KACC 23026]